MSTDNIIVRAKDTRAVVSFTRTHLPTIRLSFGNVDGGFRLPV